MISPLTLAGLACSVCGFTVLTAGWVKPADAAVINATGASLMSISFIHQDNVPVATCFAAFAAFFIHTWWNGGGGDTKRRLKKTAKKFQATRRTAPTTDTN